MSVMEAFVQGREMLGMLLGASAIGAIAGSLISGSLGRRSAKKAPKTEMRAEAYRDFVVYVISQVDRANGAAENGDSFCSASDEIKAKLLLFGETSVVHALDAFLGNHTGLDSEEARHRFADVILSMRKSLLTGHRSVRGSILNLIDKPAFGP